MTTCPAEKAHTCNHDNSPGGGYTRLQTSPYCIQKLWGLAPKPFGSHGVSAGREVDNILSSCVTHHDTPGLDYVRFPLARPTHRQPFTRPARCSPCPLNRGVRQTMPHETADVTGSPSAVRHLSSF